MLYSGKTSLLFQLAINSASVGNYVIFITPSLSILSHSLLAPPSYSPNSAVLSRILIYHIQTDASLRVFLSQLHRIPLHFQPSLIIVDDFMSLFSKNESIQPNKESFPTTGNITMNVAKTLTLLADTCTFLTSRLKPSSHINIEHQRSTSPTRFIISDTPHDNLSKYITMYSAWIVLVFLIQDFVPHSVASPTGLLLPTSLIRFYKYICASTQMYTFIHAGNILSPNYSLVIHHYQGRSDPYHSVAHFSIIGTQLQLFSIFNGKHAQYTRG